MGSKQIQKELDNKDKLQKLGIFGALATIFGVEKSNKEDKADQEKLEEELKRIQKEEEKLGSTKRINKLRESLQSYEIEPKKVKNSKKTPTSKINKTNTQTISKKQKEDKDKGLELGE